MTGFLACVLLWAGPTLSIEVQASEQQGTRAALEEHRRWVEERLREEGVEVTDEPARAQITVKLWSNPDGVWVEASDDVFIIEHGSAAVMRLELLHRIRAAVDAAAPTAPPVGTSSADEAISRLPARRISAEASSSSVEPESPSVNAPDRWWRSHEAEARLFLDGGMVARGRVDGQFRVLARLGLSKGWGGVLSVTVIPSQGHHLQALDTILAAGPYFNLGLGRHVRWEVGALLGAEIHSFRQDVDRGGAASWYLGLPLAVSWGRGPLRLHGGVQAGLSGASILHARGSEVVWERKRWSIGASLGVSYGWRIS